jgi:hypothetical protein
VSKIVSCFCIAQAKQWGAALRSAKLERIGVFMKQKKLFLCLAILAVSSMSRLIPVDPPLPPPPPGSGPARVGLNMEAVSEKLGSQLVAFKAKLKGDEIRKVWNKLVFSSKEQLAEDFLVEGVLLDKFVAAANPAEWVKTNLKGGEVSSGGGSTKPKQPKVEQVDPTLEIAMLKYIDDTWEITRTSSFMASKDAKHLFAKRLQNKLIVAKIMNSEGIKKIIDALHEKQAIITNITDQDIADALGGGVIPIPKPDSGSVDQLAKALFDIKTT